MNNRMVYVFNAFKIKNYIPFSVIEYRWNIVYPIE